MHSKPRPSGRVKAHRVNLDGSWTPLTSFVHNDVLFDWATIVGNLLSKQGVNYAIGGMYIEFQNVASPGDHVPVPNVNRADGVAYYNDLATSPDTDYLRVPVIASTLASTDPMNFPGGNEVTFFAQTSGLVGVHGKPFSDVDNSVVYGGALVSFVNEADPTQDLVFSRFYFDIPSQQPKLSTSQIGLEWPVTLE
jgi:hypothetical protein